MSWSQPYSPISPRHRSGAGRGLRARTRSNVSPSIVIAPSRGRIRESVGEPIVGRPARRRATAARAGMPPSNAEDRQASALRHQLEAAAPLAVAAGELARALAVDRRGDLRLRAAVCLRAPRASRAGPRPRREPVDRVGRVPGGHDHDAELLVAAAPRAWWRSRRPRRRGRPCGWPSSSPTLKPRPKPRFAPGSANCGVQHLLERRRLEDLAVGASPAGEERAQNRAEIDDRGVHAAGRGDAQLERRRREDAAVERPHVGLGQVRRHLRRRLEAALAHAERVEHRALHGTSRTARRCTRSST